MGWKDGKKPEQYLFTITDDFSENWNALKEKAKKDENNISDALRLAAFDLIMQLHILPLQALQHEVPLIQFL